MPVSGVADLGLRQGDARRRLRHGFRRGGPLLPASLPAGPTRCGPSAGATSPAPARQVTVLAEPGFDLLHQPQGPRGPDRRRVAARARELQWLERHKRRSVLEERDDEPRGTRRSRTGEADLAERLAPLALEHERDASSSSRTREVAGTPAAPTLPTVCRRGSGVVRLKGRLGDSASFSVGGLWPRTEAGPGGWPASSCVDPGGGHEIRLGAGYGTRLLRLPLELPTRRRRERERGERCSCKTAGRSGTGLSLTAGAPPFLHRVRRRPEPHRPDGHCGVLAGRVHAPSRRASRRRTLAPGGDLLTLSTLAAAPGDRLRVDRQQAPPERTLRYEMAVEQSWAGRISRPGPSGRTRGTCSERFRSVHGQGVPCTSSTAAVSRPAAWVSRSPVGSAAW